MQGNARGMYEWRQSAGERRGMQGNTGNARGTYRSGCKVPGECWGMQGNVWEWVQTARVMQGNEGNVC